MTNFKPDNDGEAGYNLGAEYAAAAEAGAKALAEKIGVAQMTTRERDILAQTCSVVNSLLNQMGRARS